MASIIERLTEGVVNRDMRAEGHALLSKWERTGLLEGLENDRQKNSMARLLENQAKELLREASTLVLVTLKVLPLLHSQSSDAFSLDLLQTISFLSSR